MQKLVWQNANGDEINLTGGNYGITEWEGFSNASLNIQNQQVPFQDGAVFLDALIEPRELSVTLKMQDKGNLETRYEMRRELIHALNPKLGEGYLIYTNDFISKRIKCIPQIPLFETHNSDTRGTPKASLAWTACEPYWEDLEETVVSIPAGELVEIENSGDIPCGVKIKIDTTQIGFPVIRNTTNNKKILLDGLFGSEIDIDTNVGNKKILGRNEEMVPQIMEDYLDNIQYNSVLKKYFASSLLGATICYGISEDGQNWNFIKPYSTTYSFDYSEVLGYFVRVYNYISYKSEDGINWEILKTDLPFSDCPIIRVEEMGLFFATMFSRLYSSPDGENWSLIATPSDYNTFFGQNVNGKLYLCSQGYDDCYIYDGNEFTQINLKPFIRIQYIPELEIYVAEDRVRANVQTSTDGITWTSISMGEDYNRVNSIGWNGSKLLINATRYVGAGIEKCWLESTDGVNFTYKGEAPYIFDFMLFKNGRYISCGPFGLIANSEDNGTTWEIKKYEPYYNDDVSDVQFINSTNKTFILFEGGGLLSSTDGQDWSVENPNITLEHFEWIKEKSLYIGFDGNAIYTSTDGVTWTLRKTTQYAGKFCYAKGLNKIVSIYGVYDSDTGKTTIHSLTSTDGINWTDTTGINFTGQIARGIMDIVYSDVLGVFVAGRGNIWLRSTDGITWTKYNDNNVYIASLIRVDTDGYFYSFNVKVYKSADGITWSAIILASDVYINSGTYSKELGLYIAVAEVINYNITMAYFISTDGINWERKYYRGTGYGYSATGYSNVFKKFITGNSKMISVLMATGNIINLISSMTADSDIGLNLEVGENRLIFSKTSGYGETSLKYRQKYIGV